VKLELFGEPVFGGPARLRRLRQAAHILVIDDEEVNRTLISSMLQHAGYQSVAVLADPTDLERQLAAQPPDLVILDLHMPERDGFSVLDALRSRIIEEHLPVLVVSGDFSGDARNRALLMGARDVVPKPFDLTDLTLRVGNQLEMRILHQDLRKQNRALVEAISGSTQELEDTRIEMIERLAVAAEYRDDDTSHHTARVGEISEKLARALGLDDDAAQLMSRAAALHDVGKIGIPDALLFKSAPLTSREMDIMRTHTTIGAHILGGSADRLLQLAEVIAMSHHERWDGCGYPHGLKGEEIPLTGRIVAVADAFDALTNDRPYRPARPLNEALAVIEENRGTQFDSTVVDALLVLVAADSGQTASA
jgi:putative two-component system response regulator